MIIEITTKLTNTIAIVETALISIHKSTITLSITKKSHFIQGNFTIRILLLKVIPSQLSICNNTKGCSHNEQEQQKQQQEQLLLLQQQEAQIKLEEAEKANARGMSGSSFMETKEEIFAKKVQLENRIRATFGASGDHDAVERIALGEAAHPHTLQLMQTAFTTPEFTATIDKEEETPSRQRKTAAGRRGAKGNKSASKRAKACALCEKGSDHAKATCGTDEAQFRCEKLRERIKDEIMEKKRKAEEALEDVAAECAEEMKEKKIGSSDAC